MREERRKELCELLELIEEDLLIELLHAGATREYPSSGQQDCTAFPPAVLPARDGVLGRRP